jgi:hypothetical protein
MKRFLLYLLRWQCSSPILAVCLCWLNPIGVVAATVVANLAGGCIFYFIDKRIFKEDKCR